MQRSTFTDYIHGSDGQRKVLKRFVHAFGPSQPTIFVPSIVDGPPAILILIDNVQTANGPIVDDVLYDSCLIQRKSQTIITCWNCGINANIIIIKRLIKVDLTK